jgi:hypothetical protein
MNYIDTEGNDGSLSDYKKNMTNVTIRHILKLISKSKTRIDICSDYKMPKSLTIEDKLFVPLVILKIVLIHLRTISLKLQKKILISIKN